MRYEFKRGDKVWAWDECKEYGVSGIFCRKSRCKKWPYVVKYWTTAFGCGEWWKGAFMNVAKDGGEL